MSIESIRPQLDDETCKKLAVWLCDNALKTTSYYIQRRTKPSRIMLKKA